jgi:hypothetical protein
MTPLQTFAEAVAKAREAFDADRGMAAWLVFYEAKQGAYTKLAAALPRIGEIPDFWRCVQNITVAKWLPIVEAELEQITLKRSVCHDCGLTEIRWPERLCPECRKASRLDTYRKAKERARIKQHTRKCPRCKVEPLNSRQKVCRTCHANGRRERNRRYQKSLKQRKIRRVHPEFTSAGTSTIPISQSVTMSPQAVEPKAVLAGGAE